MTASSGLDRLMAPQVKRDRFYRAIRRVAATPGASSGEGSTEALVRGALENPDGPPDIFTIEVSVARIAPLRERYARHPFVHPYNVSSVPPEAFPGEEEVARFHREVRSKLRNNRLEKVLGWLRQDLAYLAAHPEVAVPGIERIKAEAGLAGFDAALIDGSEFTGERELDLVYGARFILLDDTRSFKTWGCQRRLRADPSYRRIAWSHFGRNGWAVFERVAAPGAAL
jgi:hypothetical protein